MRASERNIFDSLAFKTGIIIVLIEALVLTLVGGYYIRNFGDAIEQRLVERVQLPGQLMGEGLLSLDSISDSNVMNILVGENLTNGLIFALNKGIFYSLNPDEIGKTTDELPDLLISRFDLTNPVPQIHREANQLVSMSPLFSSDKKTVRFWAYVQVETTSSQAEQNAAAQQFVIGSLVSVLITSAFIFLSFNYTIINRQRQTLTVLQQFEGGDLSVRVPNVRSHDEIGTVQVAVNNMATRLQELVVNLEERVKERTRDLELARQQAERASNAKSTFLSNMSHELRTPLNMVIGFTSSMLNMPQMYQNQTLPEVFRSDVELIQRNGQHLLGLINDILDLSKIEAGQITIDPSAIDLSEIFAGVLATSVGLIGVKSLQIKPNYPDHLPKVWADPMRVRQILLNLMSNAIKFTDTGSVTLSAYQSGDEICISIEDTGIGIAEADLTIIFDRFRQAEEGSKHGGTGLGLDICQRLAQMHGTLITVTSETNKGSVFSFQLKVATSEQLEASKAVVSNESGAMLFNRAQEPLLVPHTVLLVEDNAETRKMLRRVLESDDIIIFETHDGSEVMSLATALLPDLIVLDIHIPNLSGWDVLQQLKATPETAHIPVVILSVDRTQERAQEAGAVTSLQKPVELPLVAATVRDILANSLLSKAE